MGDWIGIFVDQEVSVKEYRKLPKIRACMFPNTGYWTPEMERPPEMGKKCFNCGAKRCHDGMVGGKIKPGSRVFCPSCLKTGFEKEIKAQLEKIDDE